MRTGYAAAGMPSNANNGATGTTTRRPHRNAGKSSCPAWNNSHARFFPHPYTIWHAVTRSVRVPNARTRSAGHACRADRTSAVSFMTERLGGPTDARQG